MPSQLWKSLCRSSDYPTVRLHHRKIMGFHNRTQSEFSTANVSEVPSHLSSHIGLDGCCTQIRVFRISPNFSDFAEFSGSCRYFQNWLVLPTLTEFPGTDRILRNRRFSKFNRFLMTVRMFTGRKTSKVRSWLKKSENLKHSPFSEAMAIMKEPSKTTGLSNRGKARWSWLCTVNGTNW